MKHDFGEKKTESVKGKELPVWITPKYETSRAKAIEMIESNKYGLTDGDFWIMMNSYANGTKMMYTGLIISHNGCLKINDALEDGFKAKWNLENDKIWAINPSSFEEVGCIHTAQGLEFDYVGVIIGDDLRYEDGQIVTDHTKRATIDQSLKGINKMIENDAYCNDVLIQLSAVEKAVKSLSSHILENHLYTCVSRDLENGDLDTIDELLSLFKRFNQ